MPYISATKKRKKHEQAWVQNGPWPDCPHGRGRRNEQTPAAWRAHSAALVTSGGPTHGMEKDNGNSERLPSPRRSAQRLLKTATKLSSTYVTCNGVIILYAARGWLPPIAKTSRPSENATRPHIKSNSPLASPQRTEYTPEEPSIVRRTTSTAQGAAPPYTRNLQTHRGTLRTRLRRAGPPVWAKQVTSAEPPVHGECRAKWACRMLHLRA